MQTSEQVNQAYEQYLLDWVEKQTRLNAIIVQRAKQRRYVHILGSVITTISAILGLLLILRSLYIPTDPGKIDPGLFGVILLGAAAFIAASGPIIGGSPDDKDKLPPPPDISGSNGNEEEGSSGG